MNWARFCTTTPTLKLTSLLIVLRDQDDIETDPETTKEAIQEGFHNACVAVGTKRALNGPTSAVLAEAMHQEQSDAFSDLG